jgi:hypothetical protein
MEVNNQDLLKDVFYHFNNLNIKLAKIKLTYNRDRVLVDHIEDVLKDCELMQHLIQTYDVYSFRRLCDLINDSFADLNSHGVHVIVTKKSFGPNIDLSKLSLIKFSA